MQTLEKIYDVIVLGAGPGGMTAALYASRSNLDTLLLERGLPGGQLNNTAEIENYSGFKKITGPELAVNMFDGAQGFGAEYEYANVQKVVDKGTYKEVITDDKVYRTRAVIASTGAEHRKLNVTGEDSYSGGGVSYCAVCDGAFFKGKDIVVVGGGDSAVEEGTYLTQFAKSVTIIHRRDELRAQQILQERAFKNEKIHFIWDSVVEEITGNGSNVTGVQIKNVKTGETSHVDTDGVFIYVGVLPNSEAFSDLDITDAEGWIETNEVMSTRVPGIYAVGDVRQTPLRQVATAVGDGSLAGNDVFSYVEELKERLAETK